MLMATSLSQLTGKAVRSRAVTCFSSSTNALIASRLGNCSTALTNTAALERKERKWNSFQLRCNSSNVVWMTSISRMSGEPSNVKPLRIVSIVAPRMSVDIIWGFWRRISVRASEIVGWAIVHFNPGRFKNEPFSSAKQSSILVRVYPVSSATACAAEAS